MSRLTLLALLALAACTGPADRPRALREARPAARYATACPEIREPSPKGIAYEDSLHLLVVFVRFPDDRADAHAWPLKDARGFPRPFTALPPYADDFVEPDPARVSALPVESRSVSAYFYHQSRNGPAGPMVISGEVWPRDARGEPYAYVPRHPNRAYHNRDADGERQAGGYGYLTAEILDALTADPRFDIGDFDATCDGQLDHLMIVVRRDEVRWQTLGWAVLTGYFEQGGWPRDHPMTYYSPARGDSVRVDWSHSGSQNLTGGALPDGLVAHELGHRLFDMANHTTMIETNDVPAVRLAEGEPSTTPKGCVFNRMCGVGSGGSDYATTTLSAHQLRRMGWARRTVVRPEDGDRTVRLGDLYRTGEVVLVPLPAGAPGDTLSLENRQPTNPFDRFAGRDTGDPFYGTIFRGLEAGGLVATLTQGDPRGPSTRYRYDVLVADDTVDVASRCDGTAEACAGAAVYAGDPYRAGGKTQLSPWTRPGTTGWSTPPPDAPPVWFAIDAVRDGPDASVVFDVVADVRRGFTVRADSWMGAPTRGATLGEIRVAAGATLTVETDVTFARGLTVEAGARLVAAPGARLRFGAGTAVHVDGTLEAEDARFEGDGWRGVVRGAGARVALGSSTVTGVR